MVLGNYLIALNFSLEWKKEGEAHLFNGSSNIPFRGLLQEIKEKCM